MRIPRKKKKKIPKNTPYCYSLASEFILPKDGFGYFIAIPCPYYSHVEGVFGSCSLIKCEIEDQCKSCDSRIGI